MKYQDRLRNTFSRDRSGYVHISQYDAEQIAKRLDKLEGLLRRVLDESSINYDTLGCEDLIPGITAALEEDQ